MNRKDAMALLLMIDTAWDEKSDPATYEQRVRLWHETLVTYPLEMAKRAVLSFGGKQARPPSLAQVLGACRELAGDGPVVCEEVLAEFGRVVGDHSTQITVDPGWFSTPLIGVFAATGAYREWGRSPDGEFDPDLAPSEAAFRAAFRNLWTAYCGTVERIGLAAVARHYGLNPTELGIVERGEPGGEVVPS